MEFTGNIQEIKPDWETGKWNITISINEPSAVGHAEELKGCKLSVNMEKFKKKRPVNANALLWKCLSDIANAMNPPVDKWDVYLKMLRRYGKFTYVSVIPESVEVMKSKWRECEVVGEIVVDCQVMVQMICYFGSSTMNTKEFSVLLDGVVSEMKEMGLQPPCSQDMKRLLDQWEKTHEKTV